MTSLLETKNVIPQAGIWIFLDFAVLPTVVAKKLPRFRPTYLFRSTGFIGDWIRNVRKKSHLQSLKSPFSRLNAKRPLDSMTKPSFGDRDNFILINYCKLSAISYSSSVVSYQVLSISFVASLPRPSMLSCEKIVVAKKSIVEISKLHVQCLRSSKC